ncbi:hypothetical protein MTR67_042049, partial [Solanum verrucosum]
SPQSVTRVQQALYALHLFLPRESSSIQQLPQLSLQQPPTSIFSSEFWGILVDFWYKRAALWFLKFFELRIED